ncbi:hypothetical protein NG831_06620 [Xanthomonas sacchari]|uniref:hypothetical protein n=1 Tax=Xanthomonas sacchari TaxID=56458 RepID=UPI002257388A|nr:hypothetical protein [Xanthomonas sacchari]MCW0413465.1 hypothetical protein [Xanthomonas sacchari]UYK67834.1 hypothetical protein NG831_06620 [Xanthomonas sacchari]
MANIKYADPSYTDTNATDDDRVMLRTGAGADARAPLVQPKGYIDGLRMVWISGTQIQVTAGAAYIPGPKRIVELSAAVTKTPALAASTWYHIYLYLNGSTADVEVVTTAPAAAYFGVARAKTSDTSRRYLGSIRTTSAAAIAKFRQDAQIIKYQEIVSNYGGAVLSNGASTTPANVACSAVVPMTSTTALINFANFADQTVVIANSDCNYTLSSSNWIFALNPSSRLSGLIPLAPDQSINYMMLAAPSSSGLLAIVIGYQYER